MILTGAAFKGGADGKVTVEDKQEGWEEVRQTSFRIYDHDGRPVDLELKEISNIVVREDKGIVRYGFKYFDTDVGQAKALADAWAAFLKEEKVDVASSSKE